MNFMRQTACLVVNLVTVNKFADLFNCTPVGLMIVFGRAHRGSTVGLLLLQRFRVGLLLSTRLV